MNHDERIAIIQALFGCEAEEAATFTAVLRLVQADPADTIAFQGDPARDCRFVVSGTVGLHALSGDGQYSQVATIQPGEVFGAYPDDATHIVEAIAQDAVELLVIGTAQLRELAQHHAAIASGLAALYAAQLANVLGRLAARVTLTARGRVFSELLNLTADDGQVAPIPVVSALAVRAQTSRETASRAISDLERRGVIQRCDTHWQIVAPRMLEDMIV